MNLLERYTQHIERLRAKGAVLTKYAFEKSLSANPPASMIDSMEAAEPFAYAYRYAGCETCEGFQNWRNELSTECPPDWMIETGKVTDLQKLYTAAPPAVFPVINDDSLREVIRVWQRADFPSEEVYQQMREALGAQPQKVVETKYPHCWYCGRDVERDKIVNNDYCCPHCDMDHDKDPQPCVICGNVNNKPGGVHYCNGPRL